MSESLYKKRRRNSDGTWRESTFWWCRFWVAGREIRRSTRETGRREAATAARRLRVELEAAAGSPEGWEVTLADLGGWDVMRARARGVTDKQIRSIEDAWVQILNGFGDCHPRHVDYDVCEAYVMRRRDDGLRGQSIRKELQALKRGLRIARRKRVIGQLPEIPTVRSDPPNRKQAGRAHDPTDLVAWLEELAAGPPQHEGAPPMRSTRQAYLQAVVVLHTGLRITEARRLKASWFVAAPEGHPVPGYLELPADAAKTRTDRRVGCPQVVLDAVTELAAELPPGEPLCPGDHKKAWRGAAQRAGVERITARDLRTTFATLAAQGAGDPAAVQAALGHARLSTTQRYLRTTMERVAGSSVEVARAIGMTRLATQPDPPTGPPRANPGDSHSARGSERTPAAQRDPLEAMGFEPTTSCVQTRIRDIATLLEARPQLLDGVERWLLAHLDDELTGPPNRTPLEEAG